MDILTVIHSQMTVTACYFLQQLCNFRLLVQEQILRSNMFNVGK